jgi:hypothetical protein
MATDAGWIVRFWHYVVYAGRVFFQTESEFIDARTSVAFYDADYSAVCGHCPA